MKNPLSGFGENRRRLAEADARLEAVMENDKAQGIDWETDEYLAANRGVNEVLEGLPPVQKFLIG